jgi:hypothetical protein
MASNAACRFAKLDVSRRQFAVVETVVPANGQNLQEIEHVFSGCALVSQFVARCNGTVDDCACSFNNVNMDQLIAPRMVLPGGDFMRTRPQGGILLGDSRSCRSSLQFC